MCALRRSALWPQLVAISLIGLGAAGCSDSGRFSNFLSSNSSARSDTTGSIPQSAPASRVESQPMPHLGSADDGSSGGGRGMGSYQPSDVTGSVAPPPPPPQWTWEGGSPIIVAPGETLEMVAHRHHVPMSAIMQANNISSPAAVHPGQHLVIPRLRSAPGVYAPPATRVATVPSAAPVGPPRTALAPNSGVHVVAPGETLNSIARLYGKSVMVLAKTNNLAPDTMVRVGQRIIIPDVRSKPRTEARAEPRAPAAPAPQPARREVASEQSPHSAWKATPVEPPPAEKSPIKNAEPVGSLPGFRWPVHGRVIARFGQSPNGQNDGIDVAVPQGTPVKAAEDGVVAYAGNELKGYGNLVLIRHGNGYVTAYAHASEILVKRGESVKRGQVIAKSGETGSVKAPELHFEIRKGATPVDPTEFLSGT